MSAPKDWTPRKSAVSASGMRRRAQDLPESGERRMTPLLPVAWRILAVSAVPAADTLRSFGHPSDGAQDDTAIFVRATANEVGWMWVVKWSYGDELFGSGD